MPFAQAGLDQVASGIMGLVLLMWMVGFVFLTVPLGWYFIGAIWVYLTDRGIDEEFERNR